MVVSLVLLMQEKVPKENPRTRGRQFGVSDVGKSTDVMERCGMGLNAMNEVK